jgi:hypothetical protein
MSVSSQPPSPPAVPPRAIDDAESLCAVRVGAACMAFFDRLVCMPLATSEGPGEAGLALLAQLEAYCVAPQSATCTGMLVGPEGHG